MSEEKKDLQKKEEENNIDPFTQLFHFYDNFSKSWSSVISDAVGSESFAQSMGQQLEGSLDAMTLFRRQFSDLMEQYLTQMNLPTRNDVVSLGKRMTHIEMVLDDIDAKLDEIQKEIDGSITRLQKGPLKSFHIREANKTSMWIT